MRTTMRTVVLLMAIVACATAQTCNVTEVWTGNGQCLESRFGLNPGTPGSEIMCMTDFVCTDPQFPDACFTAPRRVAMRLWWDCGTVSLIGTTQTNAQPGDWFGVGHGVLFGYGPWSIYLTADDSVWCDGTLFGSTILGTTYC
jgi:hypothetical protein